jgi:hypothetical protein
MGLYNHLGLYEAALVYSAAVEARLEHLHEANSERYTELAVRSSTVISYSVR